MMGLSSVDFHGFSISNYRGNKINPPVIAIIAP